MNFEKGLFFVISYFFSNFHLKTSDFLSLERAILRIIVIPRKLWQNSSTPPNHSWQIILQMNLLDWMYFLPAL